MTEGPKRSTHTLPLLGLGAFLALSLALALWWPHRSGVFAPTAKNAVASARSQAGSGRDERVRLDETESRDIIATAWLDVRNPSAVKEGLFKNAWLKSLWDSPLGQGFALGWAPFLGTQGEALRASFKGAAAEIIFNQLLAEPFRILWVGPQGDSGQPVLVLNSEGAGASAAYTALDAAARRGLYVGPSCDGATPDGVEIARWMMAEQSLFVSRQGRRTFVGKSPRAVLQAACLSEPPIPSSGDDLTLSLNVAALGRGALSLAGALGFKDAVRLGFKVTAQGLEPRGISGVLERQHLSSAPLSESLRKLVPESVPVLLSLNLLLPESLDTDSLKAFLAGTYQGKSLARQVALLWEPRGDRALPQEIAVAWGRAEDEAALGSIFSGNNSMRRGIHCGHVILSSTEELMSRIAGACAGKSPNLVHASPKVSAGLQRASSITLGVNWGKVLSRLTEDGYLSEPPLGVGAGAKTLKLTLPPEVEAARRELESLPYFGFQGTAQGASLVGEGFRS